MPSDTPYILVLPDDGRPVYAVGDVHGMLSELTRMMALIEADGARHLAGSGVQPIAVLLGDYIDRGPASLAVLQLIRARVADRSRPVRWIALMGNHEELMLEGLTEGPAALGQWLANGGLETLRSAGLDLPTEPDRVCAAVRRRHAALLDWVAALPALLVMGSLDHPSRLFVHAGIDPSLPLADQDRPVLLWTRAHRRESDYPCLVVHGHTIVPEVQVNPRRINLDTGCFTARGRLSAVRTEPGRPSILLQVERDSLKTRISRLAVLPTAAA